MGFDGTLKGCHVVMFVSGLLYFHLYHLMRDLWGCMCFLYLGKMFSSVHCMKQVLSFAKSICVSDCDYRLFPHSDQQ